MCEWEEHAHVYVCVRTAHFFETAAVSNFALYLCNFLLRKTVAACRQLNLPSLPLPLWLCCCKLATTCCSCNSVCPIANENVRQLAPFALCMNNHALTYESLSLSLCVCMCVPQSMCVAMRVCGCVCVPACVCLQSQQLPIGSKISQLQSHAPKMMINESVLVLRLFRSPLPLSPLTPLSTSTLLLLSYFTSCFQFISHAFWNRRNL